MKNKKSFIIFLVCYLAYTSIYLARLNLSVATPELIALNIADSAKIGILGSVFSVVFACGRLINGQISDKQPPWIMLTIGLLGAGLSNILFGLFPPFFAISLLWMTNAFAQSMMWSSILCVVSALYEESKAKKMSSYMVTSVAVGNILAIIVNTYIITKFGAGFAFIIPGVITIILSAFVIIFTKHIKNDAVDTKNHISLFSLLKNRDVTLAIVPTLFHGAIKDNITLWMTVYFVDKFNVNLAESALFVLFIPLIGFIGRLLFPLCYKLCGENEHNVSILGFIICLISSVPLFAMSNAVVAAICLSLAYAAISLINTSMVSIFPIRFSSTGNVASLSGLMDFITYLGSGIGSFVYGFVIEKAGYSPMYISWVVICAISLLFMAKCVKNK